MDWLTGTGTTVAIVTSLVSAGVSIYTLVTTRSERQRRVQVTIKQGIMPGDSRILLFITASNPGYRSVTLNSPGILLPKGKRIGFLEPLTHVRFPHELTEGKNCSTWTPMKALAQTLKSNGLSSKIKIRGFYTSSIDETYISKKLSFNIDEWVAEDEDEE